MPGLFIAYDLLVRTSAAHARDARRTKKRWTRGPTSQCHQLGRMEVGQLTHLLVRVYLKYVMILSIIL
jgi:hypothetical protein